MTPDGGTVYVANEFDNVSVIDTATNTVTATVPAGLLPFGVAVTPDGSKVYERGGSASVTAGMALIEATAARFEM